MSDKSETITVSLHLRPRLPLPNPLIEARRSHEHFAYAHGANPSDLIAVRAYCQSKGLTIVEERPAERIVNVHGTIAQIEQAFNAETEQHGPHRFLKHAASPAPHLGIQAVLGMESAPFAKPRFQKRTATRASGTVLGPVKTAELYGVTRRTTPIAKTAEVGILCLGGGYTMANVAATCARYGIPTPIIVDHSVLGATNSPGDAADIELLLDILWQAGMYFARTGKALKIHVAFCPNTDAGYVGGILYLIHLGTLCGLSDSWGSAENNWTSQAIQQNDQAGQSAATLGITITVASGDGGATDDTQFNVTDYMAASQWAMACGGTTLTTSGERVWNNGGSTGGGVSKIEVPQPSWQADYPAMGGRCVPDWALNADPATCCTLSYEGGDQDTGGTSAAAPGACGTIAWMCEELPQNVGYLNPTLAKMPATCFRDITEGNNNGYSATVGPDLCTGRGSPRPMEMLAFLQGGVVPVNPLVFTPAQVSFLRTRERQLFANAATHEQFVYRWTAPHFAVEVDNDLKDLPTA